MNARHSYLPRTRLESDRDERKRGMQFFQHNEQLQKKLTLIAHLGRCDKNPRNGTSTRIGCCNTSRRQ